MSSTKEAPAPFKAEISQKFLSKVDRVFNATLKTIFLELIQNARRANAKEVTLWIEHKQGDIYHFHLLDDGDGVPDPSVLLQLADSAWGDDTQQLEDPAGMGFFALSNLEVQVASQNWCAWIKPSDFRGETEVKPFVSDVPLSGLSVQWDSAISQSGTISPINYIADLFHKCTKYSGLRKVTIVRKWGDGADDDVVQFAPLPFESNYLDGWSKSLPALGVTIGVGLQSNLTAPAAPGAARIAADSHRGMLGRYVVNFKGLMLSLPYSSQTNPYLEALMGDIVSESYHEKQGSDLCVLIDVHHAKALRLVLPARTDVKQDEVYHALLNEVETFLAEMIAKHGQGQHALPYAVYKEFKDRGIDMGEANPELHRWGENYFKVDALKHVYRSNQSVHQGAYREFCNQPGEDDLPRVRDVCRSRSDYEGYKWYDDMKVIEGVYYQVNGATVPVDDIMELVDAEGVNDESPVQWVESLQICMQIDDEVLRRDADFAIIAGAFGEHSFDTLMDDAYILLSKGADIKVGDIATRLANWAWSPPEWGDDEEMTEARFIAEAESLLFEFLGDAGEAKKALLWQAFEDSDLGERTPEGLVWSMDYNGKKLKQIAHTTEEAKEQRKVAFVIRANGGTQPYEFHSTAPITRDRVAAHLEEKKVFCPTEDKLFVHNIVESEFLEAEEEC
jgi:hypothetical protein